jgi:predicted Zn-dependent protease
MESRWEPGAGRKTESASKARSVRAALAALEGAAALASDQSELDLHRGRILLDAGRPEQAVEALSRYLRAKPNDPLARATRARALLALGRPLASGTSFASLLALWDGSQFVAWDVISAVVP